MQEIKNKRILLASVLKPVDEPRMFERMAQSLVANGFDVFIAGFPPSSSPRAGVNFIPHKRFGRISVARIRVRFRILWKALSIKPEVFVITTHELMGAAILFKLFTGKKIVYDVQENYWRNIMYTNAWPKLLSPLIAFVVRWKEWFTAPFFSKFLLAEKCYATELSFGKNRSLVIENKCRIPSDFKRTTTSDFIQLIFTGTIAESTGVFEAVELAKKLHAVDPRIRLNIVGQCLQLKTLRRLENETLQNSFIKLIGGSEFVSHDKIVEAISSAHFGIVSYPPSPHTENKIPSKLYEYLACQLPILLQKSELWASLCKSSDSAIVVDFAQPDVTLILRAMTEKQFYSQNVGEASWITEEKKLIDALHSI